MTDPERSAHNFPPLADIMARAGLPMPDLRDFTKNDPQTQAVCRQQRDAWNAVREQHGEEMLPYHDDALSAEDADRINNCMHIVGYFGRHGFGSPDVSEPLENPYEMQRFEGVPTDKEYDEIAALIDGLKAGDALAIENYGFNTAQLKDLDLSQDARMRLREEADDIRRNYKESLWGYAARLARSKGIRVVNADHDAFDEQRLLAAMNAPLHAVRDSRDPVMRAFAKRIHVQRERAACNTIKDLALEMLPPEGFPMPADEDKPTIAFLFGSGHKTGIAENFSKKGLRFAAKNLEEIDMGVRMDEHIERLGKLGLLGEFKPEPRMSPAAIILGMTGNKSASRLMGALNGGDKYDDNGLSSWRRGRGGTARRAAARRALEQTSREPRSTEQKNEGQE